MVAMSTEGTISSEKRMGCDFIAETIGLSHEDIVTSLYFEVC